MNEPLGKRLVAWILLFSFALQCLPVAAWALPDPRTSQDVPVEPGDLLPRGLPQGVKPRLPGQTVPSQYLADVPSPDSSGTPAPEDSPTPEPSPEPRRYRVTPENLRARELKRQAEEQKIKEDQEEDTPPEVSHQSSSSQKTQRRDPRGEQGQPESESEHRSGSDHREQSRGHHREDYRLGVIYGPGQISGIPGSPINRLANETGTYAEVTPSNPLYSLDAAAVFHQTYANLKNPGRETIVWDFISPISANNRTARRSAASIEFRYRSQAPRCSHKEARYRQETRIYDQRSPGGRDRQGTSGLGHLQELEAVAGLATPEPGEWHWKQYRNGRLISDQTFTVQAVDTPTAEWTRFLNGQLQTIVAPFAAFASDDWLVHYKQYELPTQANQRFQVEWHWRSPDSKYNRNKFCAFLSVVAEYCSTTDGYRTVVRVYDRAYPKGRILSKEQGAGTLEKLTLYHGAGLPVSGVWRLQEKIDGVETEVRTLQSRLLATSVQTPDVIWADNQNQSFQMTLLTQPSTYIVKNFGWKLEMRDAETQAVLRTFTGNITDNDKTNPEWEQNWDGNDEFGQPVALNRAVTTQLTVNLPFDPDDTADNFDAAVTKCACEKKHVKKRPLWPRSLGREQRSQRDSAGPAPVQGILMGGKDSAGARVAGLTLQASSFGNGQFILAGPDPSAGIVHRGRMEVWQVSDTLDFDLNTGFVAQVNPGRLIYRSADADCQLLDEQGYWIRFQDRPVTCTGVPGNPPQLWIRFMNPDNHPTGTYLRNDGTDYVTGGRGGLAPGGAGWGPIYIHTLTGISQLVQLAVEDLIDPLAYYAGTLTFSPTPTSPNYATSSSPPTPPVLVASSSSYWLGANRTGMGGGNSLDSSSGLHRNQVTDLAIRTKGLTAAITRYWHSAGDGLPTGPIYTFGPNRLRKQFGWAWNFQRELAFSSNGQVCTHIKPEGGQDAFIRNPDGSWSPARPDMTATLTSTANRYTIEYKSHDKLTFQLMDGITEETLRARAFLVEEADVHGNKLLYNWDNRGYFLDRIQDENHRDLMRLTWSFGPNGGDDNWIHLDRVDDLVGGRQVRYTYTNAPVPFTHLTYLTRVEQPGNVVWEYRYDPTVQTLGYADYSGLPAALLDSPISVAFYQNLTRYKLAVRLREVLCNGSSQMVNSTAKTGVLLEGNRQGITTWRRSPAGNGVNVYQVPGSSPTDLSHYISYQFNGQNRPTLIRDSEGRTSQLVYDPAANLTSYTDALGRSSSFTYDARRNVKSATNSLQQTTRFFYDNRDRITSLTDNLGRTFQFAYNNQDDIVRTINPKQQPTDYTYTYFGALASVTNALHNTWTYNYDVNGFLAQITEPQADGIQPSWEFQNDVLGRQVVASNNGVVLERNVYDARDRVTSNTVYDPSPRVTTYSYNGFDQVTQVTDPLQQRTTLQYDAQQRYISSTRPDGTTVSRTYNQYEDVASHTNGRGVTTSYTYDTQHRPLTIVHGGNGGTERYTYDVKGRLQRWTKIDNSNVDYAYDELDRLTSITAGGIRQIGYVYDEIGRVADMNATLGRTHYNYDLNSNVIEVYNSQGRRLGYQFDELDQMILRQDPENGFTHYGYNARGQMTSASLDGLSATYRYNHHGDIVDTLWNNGLHEVETFNPLGGTLTRTTSFPGLGVLESETNTLDALGRKSNWALTVPGSTRTSNFTYDPLGQLTRSVLAVTGQTNQTSNYGYDGNTNRTRVNNATSTFNDADRNTALGYNAAGAVSQDAGNASYTYDWRDQLSSYRKGSDNATYRYDGNNLRLQKTFNGAITQYLWDGSQVLKEYAGDGSVKAAYFLGADRGAIKTGGQWYQYIKDSRGSITGMVDSTGNRVATYRASDYGETTIDQGTVYNPFRWNAEQLDPETGLVYLRNRYYQPSTGRFLQRDPIGYAGGLNLFQFAGADPINFQDPSGLDPNWKVPRNAVRRPWSRKMMWGEMNLQSGQAISAGPVSPEWAAEAATGDATLGMAFRFARAGRTAIQLDKMAGEYLGGKTFSPKLWKEFEAYVGSFGAKISFVSAEELAEHQAVAGFNAAENTLVFIKGEAVTLFQGFHELGHALHLKEVGNLAKYKLIPKKEREQWVLDWITSRPVWNHFNEVEKATQRAQPGFYP